MLMATIRITLLTLVAILLSCCSQTTVHLYSRYLSDEQVNTISTSLAAKDFVVKPNQLRFPDSVSQSSITYSPMIKDRQAVEKVVSTMHDMGWHIYRSDMLVADNHWYKENSIALMLLPPDLNIQNSMQNWAFKYTSHQCKTSLTIHLNPNGQYQTLNFKDRVIKHDLGQGSWRIIQYPIIELTAPSVDWPLYFELKSYIQTDIVGEIQMYQLSPLDKYAFLSNCSFVYGIRD